MSQLKLLPLKSIEELTEEVNKCLKSWHNDESNFMISSTCPRFGTGEGKGVINESIRGSDLFLLVDVLNHSITYDMFGEKQRMSPDDHYQDLKRIIAACNGKADRITVIMPFLYESRQHRRQTRESLDCALMLNELVNMGINDIVTFDAHDPRVQNSIPYHSLENVSPTLQFLETFLHTEKKVKINKENLIIVSPDEGATHRAINLATVLEVNMGMFYKQRDFSIVVNGRNPIIAHEYIGPEINGKDAIVIDDMISSGESMLDVCKQLKEKGANNIYVFATFGLFTHGFEPFDIAYKNGLITKVFTTNLNYKPKEIEKRQWHETVHMETYIAALIDTLHKRESISKIISPYDRCKKLLEKYK